jgi:hypothetical protein
MWWGCLPGGQPCCTLLAMLTGWWWCREVFARLPRRQDRLWVGDLAGVANAQPPAQSICLALLRLWSCAGAGDDSYTFPLWKKIVAGGISGCIGAAIANPTGAQTLSTAAVLAVLGHTSERQPCLLRTDSCCHKLPSHIR